MQTFYKIVIAVVIVGLITYYTTSSVKENKVLEGPNVTEPLPQQQIDVQHDALARPDDGISTFIDESIEAFQKEYGKADRIDVAEFNEEWHVYNASHDTFMLVGVEGGNVAQIYIGGASVEMPPFAIDQPLEELYRSMIIQSEVNVTIGESVYSFTLSEEDLHQRLLIAYEDLYAQVYVSENEGTIQGVRFLNASTLVAQQPYEMIFMGELVSKKQPTSYEQTEIDKGQALMLADLANVARAKEQLSPLLVDVSLNELARTHSEEMVREGYLSSESPTKGDIKQQLAQIGMTYKQAGSNVALSYVDAIEAMHGWLNSKSHRAMILNKSFTSMGSGVFLNNYTQVFVAE